MTILRLGAAQLHYHPAFEGGGHRALCEPTGEWEGGELSSLEAKNDDGDALLDQLRERIERVYIEAYRPRLEAVIRYAAGLDLDLLVLPEYAVPLALLPAVAEAAGPRLTVVAGTHTVTYEGVTSAGVYARFGAGLTTADVGRAIAPVVRDGKLVAMQSKLGRSKYEPHLKPSDGWAPVPLGSVSMGILVCLDFLARTEGRIAQLVVPRLDECAVLAVPSLTPFGTPEHFASNAEEMLYGYDRLVVYANSAAYGGTQLFTHKSEKAAAVVLAQGRPPALARGVEGVVAVEVRIGEGKQRYQPIVPSQPLAAAVVMDAGRWGELKDAAEAVLGAGDAGEALARVRGSKEVFARAAASADLPELARERWRYLARGGRGTPTLEHLQALVRDVWVEGDAARTQREVEKGLAEGAVRVLREVEKKAPEAQRVVAVRGWLEGEVRGKYKGVEAAGEVLEGVTEGLLPEFEPEPFSPIKADGSFERWLQNPGMFPQRLSRKGFVEFPWREEERSPEHRARMTRIQETTGWNHHGFYRAAGLLALEGHPPGWLSISRDNMPAFVSRDGHVTLWARWSPDEARLDAGRAFRRGRLPIALVDDSLPENEPLSEGVRVISREIRALSRCDKHLFSLQGFEHSPVGERFVEPVARLRGRSVGGALSQLNDWLLGLSSFCLLLGEFGVGKSTVSKRFAAQLAAHAVLNPDGRSVVFVDLNSWSGFVDLAGLVRRALGVDNIAPYRFAVEEGGCILILDGFDEMSNRVSPGQLAEVLRELLFWRTDRSKILLTCRTHLFVDSTDMDRVFAEATNAPLKVHGIGDIQGVTVLELQLFAKDQIQDYLARVTSDPDRAWEIMGKVHDLRNLAERPMLLDLIRQTLPELVRNESIALGDLYEMYVQKWAEWPGTEEWLDPEQKIAFAEELAFCIWNDGPEVKDGAVRVDQLSGILFRDKPIDWIRRLDNDAVRLELRAGTFLVWKDGGEGGYYHFAHRSFLEYMLARRTMRDLGAGRRNALDLPRFSPEVIGYCRERPGWEAARRKAAAILVEPYRKRVSENALLLIVGEEGIASSAERPWRLEGAELQQVSLRAAQLAGAWLEKADLTGAALTGANLRGARLDGAVLDGVDLGHADLSDAALMGATARGAILDGTRFERADLRGAGLEGSSAFSEAPVLGGARLEGVRITGAAWREPAPGIELCALNDMEEARWRSGEVVEPAGGGRDESRVEIAGHQDSVNGVAFSSDGARLATACSDRVVRIWEARTGRLLQTLQGHTNRVTSVAWTADGERLATGSDDKTARVWEARTGRLLQTLQGHTRGVTSVAWTADGECLATGSDDKTARVWEVRTSRLLQTLQGHTRGVKSLGWTVDGARLVTGSDDTTARVWEVRTGRLLQTLQGHTNRVTSVAWTADGERLATGSDDTTARVWEARTGRLLQTLQGHTHGVMSVAWTADGERLATGSDDKTARVWEARTGRLLQTLQGHARGVKSLGWTVDGERLITGPYDLTARVWEARTGRLLQTLQGHRQRVTSVAWTADGARLATGSDDRIARVWQTRTGRLLQTFQGHTAGVTSVAWTTDGERLATGSDDSTAQVWEAGTGQVLRTLQRRIQGVTSVAWTADGKRLATGSDDSIARVWEARTGQLLQALQGHAEGVTSVAWTADGERLATGSWDSTARVWDARTGRLLQTLQGHMRGVMSVAWTADGERLATGSYDSTARVWEAGTGRLLQTLQGHRQRVTSVAWTADGERLATGSWDSTARVWDARTGRLLQTLQGHTEGVMSVAWTADGERLATGSYDSTARVWDVAAAQALATLIPTPSGGVVICGINVVLSGAVDLSALVVRTGTKCAPLTLYSDICLRPDLVAEALAGSPPPARHVPMDTAARSIAASAHEALVPRDLGAFLHIKAGSTTTLESPWSIPDDLLSFHGFRLTLKAILPADPVDIPIDPRRPTVDLPALPPGTHQLLLTLHLGDRHERSFAFPLTVLAQNPYIAGPPVRGADLLGREADLARIRARLKNGSIRLAGERRIGKTSILHHFLDDPGPGFVPIWLDAQTLDAPASFRDWILSALRARFPDAPASQSDLFAFLRTRAAAGQTPLLLIDEIVHLRGLSVPDAGLLRSLCSPPFASVLAGSPSDWTQFFASLPHDAGSPFNTLQDVFLGPLTEAQMRSLITQAGVAPPDETTMLQILALCGGRPYLAQRLCEAALDRTYAEKRTQMKLADVDAVARETLVTGLAHQHARRWAELAGTPDAQTALVSHARTTAPAPSALHDILCVHGLFDGREWTVDPAFQMWIREREQG